MYLLTVVSGGPVVGSVHLYCREPVLRLWFGNQKREREEFPSLLWASCGADTLFSKQVQFCYHCKDHIHFLLTEMKLILLLVSVYSIMVEYLWITKLTFVTIHGCKGASHVVLVVKNPSAGAGDIRVSGSIPGWRRSPGGGHSNPLQYSCLENSIDRGAWRATVHRVTKSWTLLYEATQHTRL